MLPVAAQTPVPANVHPSRTPIMRDRGSRIATPSESDLYDITMILSENFDKFTKGSYGAPDTEVLDGFINSDLTDAPLWSANYVYQAGGAVYIDRNNETNANLCTPILEIPQNGKPITITFRARMGNPEYQFDWAEVYMIDVTDPNSPRTFYKDYAYYYNEEWREYCFVFDKPRTGTDFFFQFAGYDTSMYLDDVEIKFRDPKLPVPVPTGFSDFTDDGFTANWDAVEGADSYLVSLFTLDTNRDKTRKYILQDVPATECKYTFTGLETPTTTYYYTVKALKGHQQSPESNQMKVHSLTIPQNITTKVNDDNTVTISWDAVTGAEYYELTAMRTYEAQNDETYILSKENFDKLVSPGTTTLPDYKYLPAKEELDEWTDQPGWIAEGPAHINGAYGLIGYYAQNYGDDIYLESPIMDLSAAGGKVKLTADLFAQPVDLYDDCGARIEMYNYVFEDDKMKGKRADFEEYSSLADEWMRYSAELEGGTPVSALSVWATAGYLYIDNIEISQDLKAGDKVAVPYYNAKPGTNEVTLPIYDLLRGSKLSFRLCAVREIWDSMHFSINEYVKSPSTPEYSISIDAAGISDAEAGTQAKAFVTDGRLTVVNPAAAAVTVTDMTGRTVATETGSQLNVIDLPAKGVYVVRVGADTFKVAR